MRKEAGEYEPLFRLESWRVLVEKRADGKVETEATIKIWLGGERFARTAEGNGPVHALDKALRDAIGEIHPHLRDIELVNFKVRILDERKGTGAVTRVLIDASDGQDVWDRSACPRTSSPPPGTPSWIRWSTACSPGAALRRRPASARPARVRNIRLVTS